jgi:hypothetical protein
LAVFGLAVLLPIAPVTLHNYRAGGGFQLLSGQNDVTLYLGNNRDSTGLGEADTPAYRATHTLVNRGETTFWRQTLADIGAAPARWLQLMARKLALYLGDPELPNNVDFYAEGTTRSRLLAALPLRFGAMLALALAGLALAAREGAFSLPKTQQTSETWPSLGLWILVLYAAVNIAVVVAYSSFSRFRAPLYPALAILAGGFVAGTLAALRAGAMRAAVPRLAALIACGLLVGLMPWAAERVMSRPVLRGLPAGSVRLDAPMGEALVLAGYDPLPATRPGQPAFVTLYWRADQRLGRDLYATVQLLAPDTGAKVAQADQPIGTGSFPDYPTTQWRPGQVVRDRYLLQIPPDALSPRGLWVLAAAYDRETGQRAGERTFGLLPVTEARPLQLPEGARPSGARIGPATLAAYGWRLDDPARTLTLTLYWTAGAPMAEDAVVFVHLLDAAGRLVAGQDTRPMGGLYGTQAWQPGEGIVDEHRLELPAGLPPGEYRLAVGLYDAATQARLPVVDASGVPVPDNALLLGTLEP